ncbi:HAD family phosphatase [Deinococcus metallilatus]|uniref:HAD family phosphatase n=1 Tax=Deinococcus metallilatus TaxID=1211322 RepID=A0AAJ5F5G9_9DEIO|nr:HAD family phosphatase [Deinococcus metallilatus]MBB5294107.1 putative hydrolase of the HAD superfamily [Deinococcus metallilatus]QBY08892.1 HAD family phosphatase [Deinococcus metallilatus]RXJ10036.1 HAD family phosphatase [Deinococcus metallilatus]TLK28027.1 HAD family phosphatase [Deinococcus metallilatus]GMA16557.1 hydrolase [Deinococcus metallilatus]
MNSHLQAVLFDRDDTLALTDLGTSREAARWAAERFGLAAAEVGRVLAAQWQDWASAWWDLRTADEEEAFWTQYGEELAARLGLDRAQALALVAAFPYERYMKAVPDAREVLTELRARGLKIGVLSNTLPSIDRTLKALGLADLVDMAVASCTAGVHKPEAGAFQYALDRLGLPAGAVLFVDDRPENVQAARALGMRAVLIDLHGKTAGAVHDLWAVLALVEKPVTA